MPRELKPCGTPAAYNRHRAHGEDACEVCKRGMAEYRAAKRGTTEPTDGEQQMSDVAPDLFPAARPEVQVREIDVPQEQRRLYFVLDAALPLAMPREVSSIVREMRGLLADVQKTRPDDDDASVADELERARNERRRRREDRSTATEA